MPAADTSAQFRKAATQALTEAIHVLRHSNINSIILRSYSLPLDSTQINQFSDNYIKQFDKAMEALLARADNPESVAAQRRPPVTFQNLSNQIALVDDDALALQLSVERHAKDLHELTQQSFCLLSLRMEKLAGRRFDKTQNPLHPLALWYLFRDDYEKLLPSKYDRKSAVRYWSQLLCDDDWLQLLSSTYSTILEKLNQWMVSQQVLTYAGNEDITTRYYRKDREREQAHTIRQEVLSSLTGKPTAMSNAAPATAEINQQLAQLIAQYKPPSAMAPYVIPGDPSGEALTTPALSDMLHHVDALQVKHLPQDPHTGYLAAPPTQNLAQVIAQHTDINHHELDKRAQSTIAVLSMIFERLRHEETIAPPIQALLAGLHIPVLDNALSQEKFFLDADNPAQQLISEFATVGTYWSPKARMDHDALYKKLLSIVENVQQHYHTEKDIFEHSLQDLQEFLDREDYKSSLLSERVIEAEQARLRSQRAREAAQSLIAERVADQPLPALTAKFLSEHWQQVLFFNLNKNPDPTTATMKQALASLDGLIAAAKGDISIDLHALLIGIRNQLIENGSDFPERQDALRNLFMELKVIHSGSGKSSNIAAEKQADQQLETIPVDLPLAKKAREKPAPAATEDNFSTIVDNLHNNVWFKFQKSKAITIKIKLAAIIKANDSYIFVDHQGKKVFADTREGVAARLRNYSLVPIADGAHFERALQAVIRNLSQPNTKQET